MKPSCFPNGCVDEGTGRFDGVYEPEEVRPMAAVLNGILLYVKDVGSGVALL